MKRKDECCDDIPPPALPNSEDAALAQLAQALGHPARVAIMRMLQRRKSCVCGEIVGVLPLAQSTVSQHLKVLKDAGWVHGEVDGPRVCYCINPEALKRFGFLIGSLNGASRRKSKPRRRRIS